MSHNYVHGTNSAYQGLKCRCDECRAAHRDSTRRYRAKKYKQGWRNKRGVLVPPDTEEVTNA